MNAWQSLEPRLQGVLTLDRAPIAVAFLDAAPTGVRRFMGQVPSGCSFWSIAASAPAGKSAFYTVPSDHYNCPIGAYTHRIDLPAERAHELTDVLGFMAQIGYLKMEEVPGIPRWATVPGAIVYARLGEMPVPPDAIVLAVPTRSAMLLTEATLAAGGTLPSTLPRPTCMAIPAAVAGGTTLSHGCVGNRVYTDVGEGDLYVMLRTADVEGLLAALPRVHDANRQLLDYHQARKQTLLQAG
ncbi:MAG: hypothetical protein EXR72_27200 [Myxococcales bacterium]|nr:hypothetical protein [Myxococcales bacterium]